MQSAERHLLSILTGQGLTAEAAEAVLAGVEGNAPSERPKPPTGLPRASRRREKMFGLGRPRALDRNAKVRIMHWARCLSRRTEKGRAYGRLTAKALTVLEALLWVFHNRNSGWCFPSYEKIAEAAGCARSSIAGALKALESCGILSWVHRLKRVREPCPALLGDNGWRWRVLRTSNAYNFRDPGAPSGEDEPSKANFQSGTPNQEFFSPITSRLTAQIASQTELRATFLGARGGLPG
jgi:Helix-turn-helix domain